MAKKEGVSELEYVVLGVVRQLQPCTAYRVRMAFLESPSGHWSGSAGAIYPVVRRLESRGFLRGTARPGDGRSARTFKLTAGGRAVFKAWLKPPLPDAGLLMALDPLRVRVGFLSVLTPRERLAVLLEAEDKLRVQLTLLNRKLKDRAMTDDPFERLAHRGAILSLRAQLTFLSEVHRMLST